MRARFARVALALGVLAPPATAQSLASKPGVASAISVFDAWLEATRKAKDEPGLAVAIVHDQELVWAKAYGEADRERRVAATPASLFRIASVSKLFTTIALLQLRDAGKLGLDDPVETRLAWFQPKRAAPDSNPITIRHLLTHTSGLPRELPLPYWNDLEFPSREEMMRLLPAQSAVFPPETEWKYSNLALAVAGEVVAAVAGEPYERYVQRRILDPLGMTATLVMPRRDGAGIAIGYRRRVPGKPREPEDFIDTRALSPAASLASNVLDLARLVSLQFREGPEAGAQVLKGATLREMRRPQWLRPDWQSAQALGFLVRRVSGQQRVGHDGTAPGYRSQLDFDPATKIGVIALSNAYDSDAQAYVDQAFAIVGPTLVEATRAPQPKASADPAWAEYVATYTWKHADVQVLVLDGELTMIVPDASNPWESRVRLIPVAKDTFQMKGGGANGELLRFERDAKGRVTRLVAGSYYRIRVEPGPR